MAIQASSLAKHVFFSLSFGPDCQLCILGQFFYNLVPNAVFGMECCLQLSPCETLGGCTPLRIFIRGLGVIAGDLARHVSGTVQHHRRFRRRAEGVRVRAPILARGDTLVEVWVARDDECRCMHLAEVVVANHGIVFANR